MVNDTSKRDEWLTGLIDSRLTDAEAESLQSLLNEDCELRETLHALQSNREALRQTAALNANAARPLSVDFADRVLAQIVVADRFNSEEQLGQSVSHGLKVRERSSRRVAILCLVVAASVAGIALLGNLLFTKSTSSLEQIADTKTLPPSTKTQTDSSLDGGTIPENPFASSSANSDSMTDEPDVAESGETRRYVSDPGFNVSLTLVLDIELTPAAVTSGVLDSYIRQSGMQLATPIEASRAIEESLANSRMLPLGSTPTDALAGSYSQTKMYFVHSDLSKLSKLLEAIYRDVESVPTVRFDVAFDTGINGFMESIAANSGDRFALNESTAAPLSFDAASGTSGALKGSDIPTMGIPVASSQRGREQSELISGLPLSGQSCALLLVRVASDR